MGQDYTFWVHGTDVVAEYTPENQQYPHILRIVRNEKGTTIWQRENTDNWFHFAIPTPSQLENHGVNCKSAYVRWQNNNAKVLSIKVSSTNDYKDGRTATYVIKEIEDDFVKYYDAIFERYNPRDYGVGYSIQLSGLCQGPLVISVHVEFGENGRITFYGAGAKFIEK
jgi:hypothetical protein